MQRKNTLLIIAAVLVILIITVLITINHPAAETTQQPVTQSGDTTAVAVTITEQQIDGKYYSGTTPGIVGSGAAADAARQYIDQTVQKFAALAQKEVPDRRKEFGADSPAGMYTIDLKATIVESATTQSIVIDGYVYMGGANGNSTYKVFTASKKTNTLLSLDTVINKDAQPAFVAMVKKALVAAHPETFSEDVQKLTMQSFDDWSLDQNGTLTVYFDKYEIGPGALGAVAFPLSKAVISNYIAPETL